MQRMMKRLLLVSLLGALIAAAARLASGALAGPPRVATHDFGLDGLRIGCEFRGATSTLVVDLAGRRAAHLGGDPAFGEAVEVTHELISARFTRWASGPVEGRTVLFAPYEIRIDRISGWAEMRFIGASHGDVAALLNGERSRRDQERVVGACDLEGRR